MTFYLYFGVHHSFFPFSLEFQVDLSSLRYLLIVIYTEPSDDPINGYITYTCDLWLRAKFRTAYYRPTTDVRTRCCKSHRHVVVMQKTHHSIPRWYAASEDDGVEVAVFDFLAMVT